MCAVCDSANSSGALTFARQLVNMRQAETGSISAQFRRSVVSYRVAVVTATNQPERRTDNYSGRPSRFRPCLSVQSTEPTWAVRRQAPTCAGSSHWTVSGTGSSAPAPRATCPFEYSRTPPNAGPPLRR